MANTYSLDLERSSSQYAAITDAAQNGALDITGDFTLECYVKLEQLPSTAGGEFVLISKEGSTSNRAYNIFIDNSQGGQNDILRIIYSSDATGATFTDINSDAPFMVSGDVGIWVHIAMAVDVSAQTATMYKNGVLKASTANNVSSSSIRNGTADFTIGADSYASRGLFFDGLIDEVRLWNDIRTQGEIQANYRKELVGNEANLAGYWKLNNNYTDSTSNGNNLTASGSPVFSADVPFFSTYGNPLFFSSGGLALG